MLHEGNQIHTFILCLWELCDSISATVPVPIRFYVSATLQLTNEKHQSYLTFYGTYSEHGGRSLQQTILAAAVHLLNKLKRTSTYVMSLKEIITGQFIIEWMKNKLFYIRSKK